MGVEAKGRQIACLRAAGRCDPRIVAAVHAAGWSIEEADVSAPGTGRIGPADARVALVCLPTVDHRLLESLEAAAPRWRHLELIAVVGPGVVDDERVQEFVGRHCIDYQHLPLDEERLQFAIGHAAGMAALVHRTRDVEPLAGGVRAILGQTPAMVALRRSVERMAQTDAPVMITGESGTGKELVARALHQLSPRRDGPFIAVNCVSLPPSLIHAELFGFEKGAFTGAHKRKTGHLEAAHGGTILLDEIGDLTLELQALLLRFLEERQVRRVGGLEEFQVDVRVLAATNLNLEAAVRAGRFREDLYYRLNVLRIHVPPLRERRADIALLAEAFLHEFAADRPGPLRGFGASALHAMQAYDWPGNVRELINRVRRAMIMAEDREISAADLQLADEDGKPLLPSLEETRADAERDAIVAALGRSGGDNERAAELLGVSRATFYRLLHRHHLVPAAWQSPQAQR